jgi:D-alanyl-D-alanine carboxypeptidase (penicillin-binding protein 5/6)
MKHFRWLAALLLLAVVPPLTARQNAEAPPARAPYVGAIAIDADSGQVLFEDNADGQSPPASMTKLMTFAVLHDKLVDGSLRLDTPVTVTAPDSKIGGTQVWLKEKEVFPVEELVYAMMIQSANDAAYALARTAAGSTEAFVELMNAKARALGLAHTTFRTPHGLPPASRRAAEGDLTTPRDFAMLCRYLVLETDIVKYTAVRSRPFGANRPGGAVAMNNHNHLLGKVAGLDGLKTGFTNGAGYCLSATAERHGRRVIVVTMGGGDSKSRDFKVAELIERGFASLPPKVAQTVSTTAASAISAAPTVKAATGSAAPAASEQTSTSSEPVVTFRIIPPAKKP